MHWPVLVIASLFEAGVPLFIIRSENYTNLFYDALLAMTVFASIFGLRFAMRAIPLSVAHMVWTALGILGTALVGVTVLGESLSPQESLCLVTIVVAVAGLRVSSLSVTRS